MMAGDYFLDRPVRVDRSSFLVWHRVYLNDQLSYRVRYLLVLC